MILTGCLQASTLSLCLLCFANSPYRHNAVHAFMTTTAPSRVPRRSTKEFVKKQTTVASKESSFQPITSVCSIIDPHNTGGINEDGNRGEASVGDESTRSSSNNFRHPLPSSLLITNDADDNNAIILPTTSVGGVAGEVWKARSLLIVAAALYGTNFSFVKLLGETLPVGVSLSIRFALAALVTLPWLFEGEIIFDDEILGGGINLDIVTATWLGFEVGLWNSIGYVAQAVGLETTPASKSAFICSLAVVVVPLLNFFFAEGKKIETRQWIGAILAVAGVGVLELSGGDGVATATTTAGSFLSLSRGDLLSLVQPFAFGIGFWKIENALQRYPTEARRLTAAQLLAVFMASLCYGLSATDSATLASIDWSAIVTSPMVLFSLFWTGVITTALTIYMENKAMETLSATEATVIFATEPLWGTAFAATVMGEQLGLNSVIGAAFIMTACFYSNLGKDGITRAATQFNNNARQVPARLQNQGALFATSVTASWASWNVAMANAVDTLPDDTLDALEKMAGDVFDNLPW